MPSVDTEVLDTKQDRFATDREDYQHFLAQFGITQETATAISENASDQIAMPGWSDDIEVRDSPIHGKGLFTNCRVHPKWYICTARINNKRTPAGRYTNHSANPNARFDLSANGDVDLVSLRHINAGDEITVDYRQALSLSMTARQKVERMEVEMLEKPQVYIPIAHYFGDGIYAREMLLPKGVMFTGKIHKYTQINILSKGDISVLTEEGIKRVQAPFTLVAPPGTKRIGIAHEDCVWTTILRTDLTDPDEIEETMVAETDQEYREFQRALEAPK